MPCSPHPAPRSLWHALSAAGRLPERMSRGAPVGGALGDLRPGSGLGGRREELRGRSVVVSTADQLTAALALIELDGVASRLVLCPPDLPVEQRPFVVTTAAADAWVCDMPAAEAGAPAVNTVVRCSPRLTPADPERKVGEPTEGILATSGTTAAPKVGPPPPARRAGRHPGGGAAHAGGVEHVLRHPPLRRAADLPARGAR